MTTTDSISVWDTMDHASLRQRRFLRFLTATLVDLVVLNLFVEYLPQYVTVDSFTITLLAAVVLQVLLKLTLVAGASARRLLQREARRLCEIHALFHCLARAVRLQVPDSRSARLGARRTLAFRRSLSMGS